jgi:hypothetical protein
MSTMVLRTKNDLYDVRDPRKKDMTRTFDIFGWLIGGIVPAFIIFLGECYCWKKSIPPLISSDYIWLCLLVAFFSLVFVTLCRLVAESSSVTTLTTKLCMSFAAFLSFFVFHVLVAVTGGSIQSQLSLDYLYIPTVAMMVFRDKWTLIETAGLTLLSFALNLTEHPLFFRSFHPQRPSPGSANIGLYKLEYFLIFILQLFTAFYLHWKALRESSTSVTVEESLLEGS